MLSRTLAFGFTLLALTAAQAQIPQGQKAPPFSLPYLQGNGRLVGLNQLRGKLVVLAFFRTG